ncbi:hypothetical protein niasHT_003818 [Heterodera trifolii]|uniref:MSP domain-containing protein n=1 Tax=Heterodera trifolii TaxID=157864 RepID=A0ABD2LWR0_9BILA
MLLSSSRFSSVAVPFLLLLNSEPFISQLNETVLFSPSPLPFLRFLRFSVWAPANCWLRSSNSSRVLTIIESFNSEEMAFEEDGRERNGGHLDEQKKPWQMVLWLFTNTPEQRIPFVTLVKVDKQIQLKRITECERTREKEEKEKRMEVEVEVSTDGMFMRAKNAVRYPIPNSMDSAELKVYFVGNDQSKGQLCQLKSQMEFRGTSKFAVPPTTPITPTDRSSQILPSIVRIDHKWPYSRKRPKIPRRSTMAAQRLLTPAHYASPSNSARPFIQRKSQLIKPVHFGEKSPAEPTEKSTRATYIDIIRDRQLYEEVQRSKTNELNSRWSTTFFVFMLLVALLITTSAAFALLLSLLLQCRPKSPKHSQPTIATIVQR